MAHFRANITIGILETDPGNSRRKRLNFLKGRNITKWYRAQTMGQAMTLVGKTKFARIRNITEIAYKEYVKGVEKHHEY